MTPDAIAICYLILGWIVAESIRNIETSTAPLSRSPSYIVLLTVLLWPMILFFEFAYGPPHPPNEPPKVL